jgi:hypothetical protein
MLVRSSKFLLQNFPEILRDPELFNIQSRVPKSFGIPVVLIDITGTINRGLSGLGGLFFS